MGDRACVGDLEGLRDDGELSAKSERDSNRHAAWVQGREGYRESDFGGEIGIPVGGDCTQAAVPGVPGRAESVRFPG